MAVPDILAQSEHIPRFTPSAGCKVPPPESLTQQQITTLDTFRTHVHTKLTKNDAEKRWTDDPCLVRFLKARRWNHNEAAVALQDTLQWRAKFKPMIPDKDSIWEE
ncbi:hypothetical protein BGZ76_005367, partial [Entomortierella beljakovae]